MQTGYYAIKQISVLLLIFISSTFIFSQQYLVNSEWSITSGNDTSNYFYKRAKVKTDIWNNVYTLGSSLTSTSYDFLLMKQNSSGDTLFIKNWNGDGDKEDVATDMYIDSLTGSIYVVGGSVQDSTWSDSLDAVIVAFDNNGTELWHTYASNNGPYSDIFMNIAYDGSNLYGVGTVHTALTGRDFLITGFDMTGVEQDFDVYDYNGHDDIALQVTIDPNNSITIAGISETTDSTWDYYIRRYKTGPLTNYGEYRNYAGSGQLHQPTDIAFKNGYYYLTGGVKTGITYDIKTICMDTTLSVVWEQTWDGPDGIGDVAYSLKINNDGDVFITGQTGTNNYTTNIVTIKYNNLGVEKWVRFYDGAEGNYSDRGYDIEIDNHNIYVIGAVDDGANCVTICYDTAGTTRWLKKSPIPIAGKAELALDNEGNIILGLPIHVALYTEKLSVLEQSNAVLRDTGDAPLCKKNEVIIKFNPSVIKTDIIDNRDQVFGKLNNFIQDSTILKMNAKMGFDLTKTDGVNLIKIFKRFTTADSLSLTRLGDTIKIEEIWSTLILTIPDTTNIVTWIDSLKTITSDIFYVEENGIVSFMGVPNDIRYIYQDNLKTYTYLNAGIPSDIEIEDAWDIETGQRHIKVGVYDTGIDWEHIDFSRSGSPVDFVGSVAHTGYDYINNLPITSSYLHVDDFEYSTVKGHGTLVAGIIGARRNNNEGIAGIAGGDGSYLSGVELNNFKVSSNIDLAGITDILNGVMEGSYLSMNPIGNIGYGINISNHSYAWPNNVPDYPFLTGTYFTTRKVYYYAWRNGVTQVASRGNWPTGFGPFAVGVGAVMYPSCLNDDWVICVGAAGTNRARMDGTNGDPSEDWSSMNGRPELDLLAPGVLPLVAHTTNALSVPYIFYRAFNGTSAAAPHVAGAAALIESYYNNADPNPYNASSFSNLCADDVEHLVQEYANDIGSSVYNPNHGWGNLNVTAIFEKIKNPEFDILHFHGDNPVSRTTTKIDSNITITIDEPVTGYWYPAGSFTADRYEVQATFNHTLPSGYTVLDYWPIKSHALGLKNATLPYPNFPTEIEIVSCNATSITLKTHIYDITAPIAYSGWLIGLDETLTRFPYALHIQNPTIGIEEQIKSNIKVFPNPTTEIVNVSISSETRYNFSIFDINGRILNSGQLNDSNTILDVSSLSSGMYFIKVYNEKDTETFKIIKH